jgi:beta-hydroxylase
VFLDPRDFEFTSALESQWEVIRDEYLSLPADTFDPWVQREMHGGGWNVFGLFAAGQQIPAACARCPETSRALRNIPGLSMAGFSRLSPRAHVKPHVGWAASVYRLHLGLVIPPGCRLRVSDETRAWQEGHCLIFDDTVEHEAWNDSEQPRGVLLLDFLRPGVETSVADHVPEEVRQYAQERFGLTGSEPRRSGGESRQIT